MALLGCGRRAPRSSRWSFSRRTSRTSFCGSLENERKMNRFQALFQKELLRFWKVAVQTVAAPVLTAALYLVVFAHALEGRVRVYDSVPYTDFLVPGLVMMSVLQNAFANSSSSLVQ